MKNSPSKFKPPKLEMHKKYSLLFFSWQHQSQTSYQLFSDKVCKNLKKQIGLLQKKLIKQNRLSNRYFLEMSQSYFRNVIVQAVRNLDDQEIQTLLDYLQTDNKERIFHQRGKRLNPGNTWEKMYFKISGRKKQKSINKDEKFKKIEKHKQLQKKQKKISIRKTIDQQIALSLKTGFSNDLQKQIKAVEKSLKRLSNRKIFLVDKSLKVQKKRLKDRINVSQKKKQYSPPPIKQKSKEKPIKNLNTQVFDIFSKNVTLTIKTPRCKNQKCKALLDDHRCSNNNHFKVSCSKCHTDYHKCIQGDKNIENYIKNCEYKNTQDITIKCTGNIFEQKISSLKSCKQKNNIESYLKSQGYQYISHMKFMPGFPQKVFCSYPVFNKYTTEQILINRTDQLQLPIEIKKSSIPQAGLGVFAKEAINKNLIICSYLGQIGITSFTPSYRNQYAKGKKKNTKKLNDSLFSLGWIESEGLMVAPNRYSNVARFINYQSSDKCNINPCIGMIKYGQSFEPVVLLISSKKIAKGDELFYQYGPEYNLKDLDQ